MADRIMFFYCYWKLKKRINIRIHRDIEGPPKRSSGKQDVVGDGVDIKTGLYTSYVYKPINICSLGGL